MFDEEDKVDEDLNVLPKEDLIARHKDSVIEIENMQLEKERRQFEITDLRSQNDTLKDEVREMKEQIALLCSQIDNKLGTTSPASHQ